MSNVINWFEIPAADFDRAHAFYAALYDVEKLYVMDMMAIKMGILPMADDESGVGGAICFAPGSYTPSENGAVVYLNGNPDLSVMLARVEPAGGKILRPKTLISEDIGYMALFLDSEGNRIALHSQN